MSTRPEENELKIFHDEDARKVADKLWPEKDWTSEEVMKLTVWGDGGITINHSAVTTDYLQNDPKEFLDNLEIE